MLSGSWFAMCRLSCESWSAAPITTHCSDYLRKCYLHFWMLNWPNVGQLCFSSPPPLKKGVVNSSTLNLNCCIETNVKWSWHAVGRNDSAAAHRHQLNTRYSCKLSSMLLPAHCSLLAATLNQTSGYCRLLRSPRNIKPTVWLLWFHVTAMSLVNDLNFYPLWAIHIPTYCRCGFHFHFCMLL